MAVKLFCDRCGKETQRNYVSQHVIVALGGWEVEIAVTQSAAGRDGVLCEDCLFQIIREGQLRSVTRGSSVIVRGNIKQSVIVTGDNNISF